jgi:ATP-binding cassette, subfamily B, bacterial CvaB/MchF/RaxB
MSDKNTSRSRIPFKPELQPRLKPITQVEMSECGLACIAMICSYHGNHIDMAELRGRFSTSLRGMDLAQLLKAAGVVGLGARALRADIEYLGRLKLPCVLHWNMTHFVVLEKIGSDGDSALIHDPSGVSRWYGYKEISDAFTGVAVEFEPNINFRTKPPEPRVSLRQLVGETRGFGKTLLGLAGLSVLVQLLMLAAPLLLQWTFDRVLVTSETDLLIVLGIGFLAAASIQTGLTYLRNWLLTYVAISVNLQWGGSVFAHLLRLPISYFETRSIGDVVSRLQTTRTIQSALSGSVIEGVVDGVFGAAILVVLFFYSPKMTFITLTAVTAYCVLRIWAFSRLRDLTHQQVLNVARQQSHMLETLRGIQAIKVAGRESIRASSQLGLMVSTANKEFSFAKMNIGIASANQFLFNAERVFVVVVGAFLVLQDQFSAGMLIAFIAYKDQFVQKATNLIDKASDLRMLNVHVDRLSDIVLTEPEQLSGKAAGAFSESSAGARLKVDVSYRYADGLPWVLKNCEFSVEPGESVAIVGPSGCGKSTLARILVGILAPSNGHIQVGGFDIQDVGLEAYRNLIGAVMQNDDLFAGTIEENIAFFDPSPDVSLVHAAAKSAAIDSEIDAMPMRYKTLVGDMGSALSGGQKQRVLIARALYRNPRILVLDEATSHLDIKAEAVVNRAIAELKSTRIFIAHRPDTVASADRVLVMAEGRIVRECTPQQWLLEVGKE